MVAEVFLAGAITCRVAYSDPIRRVRPVQDGRAHRLTQGSASGTPANDPNLFHESQGASLKPWNLSEADAAVVAQVLDKDNPAGKPTYVVQDLPMADAAVVIKHRR